MASITNLEDLPQLVMEKITSFLDHKQLLAFEQVSRKLKCAVDDYFSTTDHLIIGPLPEIEIYAYDEQMIAKEKKSLDGLLKVITRCGVRLRTIQITNTNQYTFFTPIENYKYYCKHFLASAEVSSNCPNIEYMFASPNEDIITMSDDKFRPQSVLLDEDDTESYANNIKLCMGGTCRLRSISLLSRQETQGLEDSYQRIVNLFPNLEQISVRDPDENFYNILPQLMENGLKYLSINLGVDYRMAKKLCNICKDLRSLRLALTVEKVDDITALNKLQLPENLELKIKILRVDDVFSHLNEDVCNTIIYCEIGGHTDYTLISKLKNLQQFNFTQTEQWQVIAEGSFPKLRRILSKHVFFAEGWVIPITRISPSFLPQLLINKGNQLTQIEMPSICKKSMPLLWKALKYCKAAKRIQLSWIEVDSPSTVAYEDVTAICDLPNLHQFIFFIQGEDNGQLHAQLCSLFERAVKEHTDFQFEYKYQYSLFSLYRL